MVGYEVAELKVIRQAKVSGVSREEVSKLLEREIAQDVFDALTIKKIDMLLHNYSENTVFLPYYNKR